MSIPHGLLGRLFINIGKVDMSSWQGGYVFLYSFDLYCL